LPKSPLNHFFINLSNSIPANELVCFDFVQGTAAAAAAVAARRAILERREAFAVLVVPAVSSEAQPHLNIHARRWANAQKKNIAQRERERVSE